ncbi:MAG: DUF402 domain-containing protein [Nocardioides sp.]|uniref:DUF402 domain-containing protein n=1 Tax=Nocardioides sp. TaxID=35761 RepID=UPI0039E45F96
MAEEKLSESGGTMRRLTGLAADPGAVDQSGLEPLRLPVDGPPARLAGDSPYLVEGTVITWHYALGVDPLRVVRDDSRGLVAWLSAGSQRIAAVPNDGLGLRDRSLEERAELVLKGAYEHRLSTWQGDGILRIAPTGVPWSLWYFWDSDAFAGHYINLELVHHRADRRVITRDLTLDLWLDAAGELWLKDEDELAAFTRAGGLTAEQSAVITALADVCRRDLIEPRAWPLDEGWESWRPPAGWDEPLNLPTSP